MSGARAAHLLLCLVLGCAQTDLVATGAQVCVGNDCADSSCAARQCQSAESQQLLCNSAGLPALTGDSCGAGDEDLPISRFAVCSCSDFVSNASVTIDAFSGTAGNPAAGQAAVGVNRDLSLSAAARVDGPLLVFGDSAQTGVSLSPTHVAQPPCQCGAQSLLDVAGLVAARQRDNDNTTVSPSELDGFSGPREITLPCGRYYFTRIAGRDKLTIRTAGNVAIYVAGNLELDDALEIGGSDSGQTSLFVAGEIRVRGSFALAGGPGASGRAGLFAASRGTIDFGGSSAIFGNLYAPRAELVNTGTLELYGSLLVRRAAPAGDLVVHYDTAAQQPRACL